MKKISWGVLGAGQIAKQFCADMKWVEDGQVAAVVGRDEERTRDFAGRHGIDRAFTSLDEFLAEDGIDCVYIATPHPLHAEQAIRALNAGKNVLCEKPFTMNAAEAVQVTEVARSKGLFAMEAMWTRFLPAVVRLRELVHSGAIGSMEGLEVGMGYRFEEGRPARMFDPALGGGVLLDMGVYCASFSQMLCRGRPEIAGSALIGATGVDEKTSWSELHWNGFQVMAGVSMRSALSSDVVVSGSEGQIRLPQFWRASSLILDGERMDFSYDGVGLHFQVKEVHRCLRQGQTESQVMSLSDTIEVMERLDLIRSVSRSRPEIPKPSSSF